MNQRIRGRRIFHNNNTDCRLYATTVQVMILLILMIIMIRSMFGISPFCSLVCKSWFNYLWPLFVCFRQIISKCWCSFEHMRYPNRRKKRLMSYSIGQMAHLLPPPLPTANRVQEREKTTKLGHNQRHRSEWINVRVWYKKVTDTNVTQ